MHCNDRDRWDADYAKRGRVWGGAACDLPDLPRSARVLELGCGNGKTLAGLLPCGWDIVATDFSGNAATLCRCAVPEGSACAVIISDARASPFRAGSFDAVFAHHILGHQTAEDRITCAREIGRVLRPYGRLFFCDFSDRDFRFGSGTWTEPGTFVRGTGIRTHYFSPVEVRNLFLDLTEESLGSHTWAMRIRGKDYTRSEIRAVFVKQAV